MKQIINISSNGIKQAIDDLVNENELLQDKVYKQEEENKRLNNIINELEEYICAIEYDERHSDSWQIPVRIHNKLKELKGSDK